MNDGTDMARLSKDISQESAFRWRNAYVTSISLRTILRNSEQTLNGSFEVYQRRVQRTQEALDAPIDRLVRNVDFHTELSETRVEVDVGVNIEELLSETNRKVLEDRPCLIVECTVAIFTPVTLEHLIVTVPNHGFGTAEWAIDAVTPANLCQQVRGLPLPDKRLDWEHRL